MLFISQSELASILLLLHISHTSVVAEPQHRGQAISKHKFGQSTINEWFIMEEVGSSFVHIVTVLPHRRMFLEISLNPASRTSHDQTSSSSESVFKIATHKFSCDIFIIKENGFHQEEKT